MTKKKEARVHLCKLAKPGMPFGPSFGFIAYLNSLPPVDRPKQLPTSQRAIKPKF